MRKRWERLAEDNIVCCEHNADLVQASLLPFAQILAFLQRFGYPLQLVPVTITMSHTFHRHMISCVNQCEKLKISLSMTKKISCVRWYL
jgi:hypothetical protein